jgi:hypothetical protein
MGGRVGAFRGELLCCGGGGGDGVGDSDLSRQQAADSRQQTACSGQETADSMQQTADDGQQTGGRRQQTADSRKQTADSRHLVEGRWVAGPHVLHSSPRTSTLLCVSMDMVYFISDRFLESNGYSGRV